jgi:hypothetical protein
VLKQIDPQADAYHKGRVYHHGDAANSPTAELVRAWRAYRRACEADSLVRQIAGDKADAHLDRTASRLTKQTLSIVAPALLNGDAGFFRKLADAIERLPEKGAGPVYPLHAAISVFAASGTRLTIGELCEQLERHGLRPTGQSEESWRRRVRTVAEQVGFPLVAAYTPQSESQFTPARLGLPANYGTRSFWTRTDLLHQLHTAQAGYRRLVLRAHPDKGGDANALAQVRRLWRNVKNAFKRHGYAIT